MSAILYPVAASAEAALAAPIGRAAREREAAAEAGQPVRFVSEDVGPVFATREAALDAHTGRIDDDRPGKARQLAPEDRFCALRERAEAAAAPVEPAFAEGRRWPKPAKAPKTSFRLSISYWRIVEAAAEAEAPAPGQARNLRRSAAAAQLDAAQLRAIARQPLRPVRPQQPLDFGLFESPAPEAPHILIPDD